MNSVATTLQAKSYHALMARYNPRVLFPLVVLMVATTPILAGCGTTTVDPVGHFRPELKNPIVCVDGNGVTYVQTDGASFRGTTSGVLSIDQPGSNGDISIYGTLEWLKQLRATIYASTSVYSSPTISALDSDGKTPRYVIEQAATSFALDVQTVVLRGVLNPNGSCGSQDRRNMRPQGNQYERFQEQRNIPR